MKKIILIKFGELTTKKSNRMTFVNLLENNIKVMLKNYEIKIIKNRVRMFIEVINDNDFEIIVEKLKKVFGIHSIVICYEVDTNIDTIKENCLNISKDINFKAFKVETKRSNKQFPISSMEFNNIIGGILLKNIQNIKVDVHNPEYILKIEIRDNKTYIYSKEIAGIGGYPVGVQGKGLLMLSGGIDSPVAGYMAMKRGVKIECVYFESPPHTSLMARNKVIDLVKKLCDYQGEIKLHIIKFTDIQENIYRNINADYMITIMRRMMYRISTNIMDKRNCKVLINGESIGQVASQTLTSMRVINDVTNYPVIRPVACLDKLEIIEISKKIGTYDISILPYEDCCTIFLPKHPVINPNLDLAIKYENSFDYNVLLEDAIKNIETITINSDYEEFNF